MLAALDSIAWTFNVRGKDVDHTPVALSFALVHDDGTADLFVASEKIGDDVRQHLGNGVRVHERDDFERALGGFAGKTVAVDPERSVAAVFEALENAGARVISKRDPSILPKAIKNEVEIAGHRAAQARDGAALSRFLHWLSVEAPKGGVDELAAAAKLQGFRQQAGGSARSELRHHLRRRPQRRHRPLSGQRGDQPAARDGFDLPGRFRRPISRRHHRRYPHRRRSARRPRK